MNDRDPAAALGRFLTLADVAEILNVSVAEVKAAVDSAELPAIRVGPRGPWRIERSELETYIQARYEHARRMSLWRQGEYAGIPDIPQGEATDPQSSA